jgi:hypothetical protein
MAYNTIVLILGIAIGEDNVEESSDRKNLRHYSPYFPRLPFDARERETARP